MSIFYWWLMKLKRIILIIISRFICAVGMTMGSLGAVISIWYFFFSHNEERFLFGGLYLIGVCIGYFIYKIALRYIYDEWDDYH